MTSWFIEEGALSWFALGFGLGRYDRRWLVLGMGFGPYSESRKALESIRWLSYAGRMAFDLLWSCLLRRERRLGACRRSSDPPRGLGRPIFPIVGPR